MREIKFRCFFYDGNDYSTGEMMSANNAYAENYIDWDVNNLNPADGCTIIMQYTGIKDKNDKEIYEGDILKSGDMALMNKDELVAVKYAGSSFVIYDPDCCLICKYKYGCIGNLDEFGDYEVVGNIYQNPNLFNSEQNDKRSVATKD